MTTRQSFTLLLALVLIPSSLWAGDDKQQVEKLIAQTRAQTLSHRIAILSDEFMGKPYLNEPLGEGNTGEFNQEPLYRLDSFDCQTYVSTITAMATASSYPSFLQKIKNIRYKDGKISFINRNHFPTTDWIQNNINNGTIRNLNAQIAQNKVKVASTTIDKAAWYKKLNADRIKRRGKKADLLAKLRNQGQHIKPQQAYLTYIPLTALFPYRKPDFSLLNKIPSGSIIYIVRPNWELKSKIGTNMNVSHVGFAIEHNGTLYFRHASSSFGKKITQEPLSDYLLRNLDSPTIKGISVFEIVDSK